jgi:hypothetical protein
VRGDVDETSGPLVARQRVRAVTGIVECVLTPPDLPGEYLVRDRHRRI